MAKYSNTDVLDAALNYVKTSVTLALDSPYLVTLALDSPYLVVLAIDTANTVSLEVD